MNYRILIFPSADRQLKRLSADIEKLLRSKILELSQDPRPAAATFLSGKLRAYWRLRVGDYRIIYEIKDRDLIVTVIDAGHRREIYRK